VRTNKFTRAGMEEDMRAWGLEPGLLYERDVIEYADGYRRIHTDVLGKPLAGPRPIPVTHAHNLDRPMSIVVAGSAGGKIRSAVKLVAHGGIKSGLWAAQRDDFPVTVKAGHSVSQLWLSPEEMPLRTVTSPDVLLIISTDGHAKAGPYLEHMTAEDLVITIPDHADLDTDAKVLVFDPKAASERIPKTSMGLVYLTIAMTMVEPYSLDALREVAGSGPFAEINLQAMDTGLELVG
jgi:Pyruvate/2-oxoacid:ferredoxin oxidoreductase gamma subunit